MNKSIVKSSIIVSFFTGVSTIVSFLAQVVIAYLFGTSIEMDAYLAAIALPFTIIGIATGGFGYVIIPILMQYKNNTDELWELTNELLSIVMITAMSVAFLGGICSKLIIQITAPNLSAEKLNLAADLAPIVWIMVSFNLLSSFFIALHHLYKRFITPAVSPMLVPICMIIGGLLLASRLGIKSIVIGSAVGSAFQSLLLFPVVMGHRQFKFSLTLKHQEIKKIFLSIVPLLVSLLPFTILPVIDVFWASRLPDGSISYLGYATRIVIAITGIVVQGISVVLFPFFSEHVVNGEFTILRERILKGVKFIFLLTIPLATIFTVLRTPLLGILFQRGNFHQSSTIGIAMVLPFYLIGMIGMALMNIVSRGFYSLYDFKTPAKLGLISIILYIFLCGLFTPHFSYLGIGIAYAIYWNFTFILQGIVLGREIGKFWSNADFVFILKIAIGAIITGFAMSYLSEWLNEGLGLLFGTILSAGVGLTVFVFLYVFVFRIDEMAVIRGAAMKKVRL